MPAKGRSLRNQQMPLHTTKSLNSLMLREKGWQHRQRISNIQGLLERYDRAHWDEMEQLLQHLPKENTKRSHQIVKEGQLTSNNSIRYALNSADSAA